ncbi:MAG: hypothetical protein ABFS46_09685 [Myxococcota bacterium]
MTATTDRMPSRNHRWIQLCWIPALALLAPSLSPAHVLSGYLAFVLTLAALFLYAERSPRRGAA